MSREHGDFIDGKREMCEPSNQDILNRVDRMDKGLNKRLDRVESKVRKIDEREEKMAITIDDILDGVKGETTLIDSVITILENIKNSPGTSPETQAKFDEAMSTINANKKKVSDEITANTPAAGTPTGNV